MYDGIIYGLREGNEIGGRKKKRERRGSVCAWASSGLEHPGAQRQTSRNSGRSMDGRASATAAYVWRGIPVSCFIPIYIYISFVCTFLSRQQSRRRKLTKEKAGST